MAELPCWEVWGVRVGRAQRQARDNFLRPGDRTGTAGIDFIVWVAASGDHVLVVDTAFSAEAGARRGRVLDTRPADAVRALGFDPAEVRHVVLTHLHYDHAGNVGDFPGAEVVVQRAELAYAAGPSMRHRSLSHFYEPDDVVGIVRDLYTGTVLAPDGDLTLAPGLELHLVGGHTRGTQVVRVHTARGWVVLAGDAVHFYDNLAERNPFPAVVDVETVLDGYQRIERLADSTAHIVPGHDPQVFDRYERVDVSLPVAALHRPPKGPR
ncbi:N-acyl homoserine lactonase family protein [Cryptosporangium sp. NPDC051539]|uniref:N-acyl homoserine lactonase family protein n=1 Tax=Cryptosporangium sp. NPDC051539 TaxID=3363962 RepID=UPI0037ACF8E0